MPRTRFFLAALAVAALAVCPACIVRSVHPWFLPHDVIFENDLLGGWVGVGEGNPVAMTFLRGEGDSYIVQYSSKDGRGTFHGTLAKIAGEYYLDFRPMEDPPGIDGLLFYPTHSVARLELGTDKMSVWTLNYDGLTTLARQEGFKGLQVVWDEEKALSVVTSRPDELRAFLIAHSRDSELFGAPMVLARKK